jgi:hypothetical protein
MKHYELLRECADRLERQPDPSSVEHAMVLVHPRYSGKFPFAGGGTELLSVTDTGSNYWVPVYRILSGLAKALREQAAAQQKKGVDG